MGKCKVLVVHNAYQQRGGEDSVMDSEVQLLQARGHEVEVYRRTNDEVGQLSKAQLAFNTLWSSRTVADIDALAARFRPDVVHVHNTVPLVSPSVYWAARRQGAAVVQTLHNFRLLCPQAMFVREGRVCEDCLGRVPWAGVRHGCYRGSRLQTGAVAATVTLHKGLGTFARKVDQFIALNQFCKHKFVQGGLDADQIAVKPNFVELPPEAAAMRASLERQGGLYLGRLTHEKGLPILLDALRQPSADPIVLKVVGGGELSAQVGAALGDDYLGMASPDQIWGHLARAQYMVVPSVWYEGFPRTIVEAFAMGVPVIASRLGSLPELIQDGETGLLFNPGDPADLAARLQWAQAHPQRMREMGARARAIYEQTYTADVNYQALMAIYERATGLARQWA